MIQYSDQPNPCLSFFLLNFFTDVVKGNYTVWFIKQSAMFNLNTDIENKYDSFRNELLSNPSVVNVCRTSQLPNYISYSMRGIEWVGKDDNELSSFYYYSNLDYLYWFIWIGITYGTKENQGNWCKKSFWGIS